MTSSLTSETDTPSRPEQYNPFLYPGIDAMQELGDMGNSALDISLVAADIAASVVKNIANFWGIKTLPLDALQLASGAIREVSKQITHEYPRPTFDLETTIIGDQIVPVQEEVLLSDKPFSEVIHFKRQFGHEAENRNDPKVLIVSALSGHHATLHSPTVEGLLPNTDLHIARWKDAKEVPLEAGRFGMSEYIDDVVDMILELGPDTHVIAICQSAVPVSAALAIIAEKWPDRQPLSLTLISGPVDTSVNAEASKITDFVRTNTVESLRKNFIGMVTTKHAGAGRLVYPGVLQRAAFYAPNLSKHIRNHQRQFIDRVRGNHAAADKTAAFYPGYNTMLDMTAEFYIDTFKTVFKEPKLANGTMEYNGKYGHRIIDMSSVSTQLMTIEGGADEFCPPGQTSAAHRLFSALTPAQRAHYELTDGGHYATWAGSGFLRQVAPRLRDHFIQSAFAKRGIRYTAPTLPVIEREFQQAA